MDCLNHHWPHRTSQVLIKGVAHDDNEEGQQSDFIQSFPLATFQIHDKILNHERNERTSSSATCSHSCNRGRKQKRIYRYSTFYATAIAFIILQAPLTSSAHFSPLLQIISSSFVSNHCYDSSYCSVSKTHKDAHVKKFRQKSNTRVNGDFESVCGFGRILYNTKMETEADTESAFRQKRKRFLRSIHYRPVRYDYTSMRSSLLDDEVITNTNSSDNTLLSIDPMVPEEETYLSLMREQDIKRKLTQAINTVWKMNSNETTDKNGKNVAIDATSGKLEVNRGPTKRITIRNLWKRRHARSIEEGIRRERIEPITTEEQLTSVLGETTQSSLEKDGSEPKKRKERRFAARTIAGLISALAEEATGLEVEVNARNDTPFWGKEIDDVQINFSRLGVNALRMGGLDEALNDVSQELSPSVKESMADSIEQEARKVYRDVDFNELGSSNVSARASEDIFDLIDVDNSGALDEVELTRALSIASGLPTDSDKNGPSEALSKLASRLVKIYDTNGDGVVDREEYKRLVKDMSAVRKSQKMKEKEREEKRQERLERKGVKPLRMLKSIGHTLQTWTAKDRIHEDDSKQIVDEKKVQGENFLNAIPNKNVTGIDFASAEDISDETVIDTLSKGEGSIVFTDLKLDLRRLLFGAVPLVKHVSSMHCWNWYFDVILG